MKRYLQKLLLAYSRLRKQRKRGKVSIEKVFAETFTRILQTKKAKKKRQSINRSIDFQKSNTKMRTSGKGNLKGM